MGQAGQLYAGFQLVMMNIEFQKFKILQKQRKGTWEEFSEDMFEKVMNMIEKAVYVQQYGEFTFDE